MASELLLLLLTSQKFGHSTPLNKSSKFKRCRSEFYSCLSVLMFLEVKRFFRRVLFSYILCIFLSCFSFSLFHFFIFFSPSIHPSINTLIYHSPIIHSSTHPSIHLSIHPLIHQPIHTSIHSSIHSPTPSNIYLFSSHIFHYQVQPLQ